MGRVFDLVTEEEILAGRATAAYFLRTEEILEADRRNPCVVAEVAGPPGWTVLAGLKDAVRLIEDKPVDVYGPQEGTVVAGGPVLRIEGPYRSFARYEQALLGFLARASGIATAAARIRAAAGEARVLSFGTRRQHPALAAVIERSAYLGGVDGIGNVAAGDVIGVEAGGTMPHALVVCYGEPAAAWEAYDRVVDSEVPRVMVCDTFGDEVGEAVRAAEVVGDRLDGVRLDTPPSRRGDFRAIVREVRWALDQHGYETVEILVSGGIGLREVRAFGGVVDGFGVGGAIANADPVDFSLNLVEVDGQSVAKRGVLAGSKTVYRRGYRDVVVRVGDAGPGDPLWEPLVRDGEVLGGFDLDTARDRALEGIRVLSADGRLEEPAEAVFSGGP